MTSTGSDLNVFLEGSESERAWSGRDWQVSHTLPHLSKYGESLGMQKYFLFLKIISFVPRGVRYVLKIHFFIEFGLKMIQFKIQFKTKSKTFIQKNIYSIESRIFSRIIHSKKLRKIIQNSKKRPKYGFGALLRPLYNR